VVFLYFLICLILEYPVTLILNKTAMKKIPSPNSILWKYQNPVIVYYHMVSKKMYPYYPHGSIKPTDFREQIKYLKKTFNIISLPEAVERASSNNLLKNNLVLTIDDGFAECYSVIAPILTEENIPATFFLIDNCIDNENMMWLHQLEYLQQTLSTEKRNAVVQQFSNKINSNSDSVSEFLELSKKWTMKDKDKFAEMIWNLALDESNSEWMQKHQPYLTIRQIQELINTGFSIGSHSATHPSCDKLNFDELQTEIVDSCRSIGKKIGTEIKYFSYPFGRRAKREIEYQILENSNLECLIGGKPRLFRKNTLPFWEAYNYERNNSNLLYHLFVNSFSL
jgi:peptidoglycan/xylan/chitin deacetylase (PgdA/CDA1 family)